MIRRRLFAASFFAFFVFFGVPWSVGAQTSYPRRQDTVLDWKDSVRLTTNAALPANTRSGNLITYTANGACAAIDGVTPVLHNRILVKNETPAANNGVYFVLQAGSASAPCILARAFDADHPLEVTSGLWVLTEEGTANNDRSFFLSTSNPINLNTTALTFSDLVSGSGAVTGSGTAGTLSRWTSGSAIGAATVTETAGALAAITTIDLSRDITFSNSAGQSVNIAWESTCADDFVHRIYAEDYPVSPGFEACDAANFSIESGDGSGSAGTGFGGGGGGFVIHLGGNGGAGDAVGGVPGRGGSIHLTGGNAGALNGSAIGNNGGDIRLRGGAGIGAGRTGDIILGDLNTRRLEFGPALAVIPSVNSGAFAITDSGFSTLGAGGTCVGHGCDATGTNSSAYGNGAQATNTGSTMFGAGGGGAGITGASSTGLGFGVVCAQSGSAVIGRDATCTTAAQMLMGATTFPFADVRMVQGANSQEYAFPALTEANTLTGNTDNTAIQVPVDALVNYVTVRVTTAVTTSLGSNTFSYGLAADPARYGLNIAGTAGTTNRGRNLTFGAPQYNDGTARSIQFSAPGAETFTAGVVRVTIHYERAEAPTN